MNRHSKKKKKQLKQMFDFVDKNNDGTITINEFKDIVKTLGLGLSEKDLGNIVNAMDKDSNGELDFKEFCAFFGKVNSEPDTEEDLYEVFRVFDRDGNGQICAAELKEILDSLGQDITLEQANEMVKLIDVNGDGHISYEEFLQIVHP